MEKKPIIIISGPTGVGKSRLAVELAQEKGEIISADSMQVYKYLDIGTAKPEADLLNRVEHHLISVIEAEADYSAFQFMTDAHRLIDEIIHRGKVPFIVGGTGLYIRSLVYGLSNAPGQDRTVRKELNGLMEEHGLGFLYDRLRVVDPVSYSRISRNDRSRIIRALEVYHLTGKPFSGFIETHQRSVQYHHLWIGLTRPREELYSLINQRTREMYDQGLVDETKELLRKGYTKDCLSKKGIGYSEAISFLNHELSLEQAREITARKTRNYAKRQMTWFKKEKGIRWFDPDKTDEIRECIDQWQEEQQRLA
ncbi:MAG: tRNA (adenosine(37)-N6)-dimethylallyltransferase MiaA [bacterium]|nr:tRNA (adenosine(37)-N6)-dimethylallyltransferase MiaA [bacterium]